MGLFRGLGGLGGGMGRLESLGGLSGLGGLGRGGLLGGLYIATPNNNVNAIAGPFWNAGVSTAIAC